MSVSNFKKAVKNGFDPMHLMKPAQVTMWTLTANMTNKPDAYSCWKEEALTGQISHSDWNVCAVCITVLKPYLSSSGSSVSQTNTAGSKSGCFIATACYGDYNAPQVLVFRKFRDDYLLKSQIGIKVVNIYYRYSPYLAKKLNKHLFFNKLIRKIFLDPVFKLLCFLKNSI